MRPVVIVVILPLFQLGVEEVNVVGDAVLVEELVELLVIDAVRPLDFAIEMRCPRPDVDVADVGLRDASESGIGTRRHCRPE